MCRKIFGLIDKMKCFINNRRVKSILKCSKKIKCFGYVNILNKNVKLSDNVVLYPNVSFEGNGNIEIGKNVKIGTNTILYANKNGGLIIGDNTIIAANSFITDTNHKTQKNELISVQPLDSEKTYIGKDVWIGANNCIIKGSKINDGAVIGANSLVNKEIPCFAICVGSPARIIKYRS